MPRKKKADETSVEYILNKMAQIEFWLQDKGWIQNKKKGAWLNRLSGVRVRVRLLDTEVVFEKRARSPDGRRLCWETEARAPYNKVVLGDTLKIG